ncbi:MAG: hypothetical protein FWD62_07195 [Betaproteobacteria bacterium]|nr:hypothetical protein [Betaproteobacteria bacterium]
MRSSTPLRFAFLLACLPFAALAASSQQKLIWGEPEIIGLKRLTRAQVIAQLPFTVGDEMKEKEKEVARWCEHLRTLPLASVNCSGAVEGNEVHFVADIVEDANARFVFQVAPGPAAAARVPPEARKLLARREYRTQEISAEGFSSGEKITPSGVLVADDPELRAYDAQLRELCMGNRANLVAIVQDPNHLDRQDAANLLAWAGDPESSLFDVSPRLVDPDPGVRDAVGRFALSFMSRVEDPGVASALAHSLADQLNLPSHADRAKAVLALAQIAGRFPSVRSQILEEARAPLERLARESVLRSVGGEAHQLLVTLNAPMR